MKLNFIGTIFGSTGYDIHCREHFKALAKHIGKDIKLSVPLPPNWQALATNEELLSIKNNQECDTALCIALPPTWPLYLASNYDHFIGYLVWEGNKIPKYWEKFVMDERVDQIWVPSKHTQSAVLNVCPKAEDKIRIVPHGVDIEKFRPYVLKRPEKFTFFCNKGWRGADWQDRGGVQYLIKAYAEEFKPDEPVQLYIKFNPSYRPQDFRQELGKLGLTGDVAPISVSHVQIPHEALLGHYNQADCFVCTQMADGFCMPGLEAMACGLPLIQCKFGGQTDYMTKDNSWTIEKGKFINAKDIMYEGIKWFEPDIKEIRKILRYAFEHQDEVKEKGERALMDAKDWTWDKTAEKGIKYLNELKGG